MEKNLILTIDQGTTSTRALLYSFKEMRVIDSSQVEFTQHFPEPGWVEHDLEEIWQSVLKVMSNILEKTNGNEDIQSKKIINQVAAIGITNQRETTCVWERTTGKPLHRAIVWQDRRTSEYCKILQEQGIESTVTPKTGLPLDPYFSASKMNWLIKNSPTVKATLKNNPSDIAFGTIDSYLIYRLTKQRSFVTDVTNASRTNLFNIHTLKWDKELLEIFTIKEEYLPQVLPSNALMGVCDQSWFGDEIPINGVAGDQQASLFGHQGFEEGILKSTYGTGAFLLMNTGEKCVYSKSGLLSTIAYQLKGEKPCYALEGSLFVAGSALRWLRDQLGVINDYHELADMLDRSESTLGESEASNQGVYLVPAFSGLGTPYWNPDARGAIFGMTLKTGKKELIRATMESLAYETYGIVQALKKDGINPKLFKVDGGVVASDWLLQFMSGLLKCNIERPAYLEITALGATFLAAHGVGIIKSLDDFKQFSNKGKIFRPRNPLARTINYRYGKNKWKQAVKSVLLFAKKK